MASQRDILLLACYEMGHQPLSLAWPSAALRGAGHAVRAVDLSVEALPRESATAARLVGIAAPMHTALRLGLRAAKEVRTLNPTAHIAFYGLYAWLNADYLLNTVADSVIADEYEEPLVRLADALATAKPGISIGTIPGVSTRDHRELP
ncbi:MAG: hypothetical protein KA586_11790, partial [Candidatus Promineofilum sp.]|nr:hypothetical protein [Promineifilum sp.]